VGDSAFDQHGQRKHDGGGEHEAEQGADEIEAAFEGAIEEPVDRELFHAEHRHAADGLQTQTAEKNIEGTGHDFPFDISAFAGFDDAPDLLAGKVQPGGDEQIDMLASEDGIELGHVAQ